jgi:hypothetical protein
MSPNVWSTTGFGHVVGARRRQRVEDQGSVTGLADVHAVESQAVQMDVEPQA